MAIDSKQKYKLRKLIEELRVIRAPHTELISVYIPAGYDLNKIIQHLQEEQSTARNIKSKSTQNNVINALEKMVRHLRLFKKTPEHGLAIFSGNLLAKEGKQDLQVWSIEPPGEITTRLYRCDQSFVLEYLEDQIEDKETYGLVVVDRKETTIGLLKGNSIKELVHLTSNVPGKMKAGGQSSNRFRRIIEQMAHEFYKRIGDAVNKEFENIPHLKGILVGGPGHTKHEFIEGDYIFTNLKNKILATEDLSYTGEFGLGELVEKTKNILSEETITKEKALINRFFEMLAKEPGKTAYGLEKVKKALERGAVELLLLSESIENKISEQLEETAEAYGTKTEFISTETEEGEQFKNLSGIGAILRYKLE